jgi:hypothetical protein
MSIVLTVKTQTGSTYVLRQKGMTWERVVQPRIQGSQPLRTLSGTLNQWPDVRLGQGMLLYGPPLDTAKDYREIYTSDVMEISETHEA